MKLVIKPTAGGAKFDVEIDEATITVLQLKQRISSSAGMSATEQRLIYKGQILKDERDVASYGIEEEHVLHLVRGRPAGATSSQPTGAPSAAAATSAAATAPAAAAAMPDFGGVGNMMGGLGAAGLGSSQQEMMQQMLNSPIMQQMLDNPEVLRTMMQANPQIRQLMDSNPQFAHMLNNPEILRESMRLAANPGLMQEQMRAADRAMNNLESHPEGFNALRRMYEEVQAPLINAADSGNAPASDVASNPFLSLFRPSASSGTPPLATAAAPATSGAPNAAPLPNPWAPQTGAAAPATSAAPTGFGAGLAGMGLPDFSQPTGAVVGGGGQDMNAMLQMLENPMTQQMMSQMLSSPGTLEAMMGMNPQLQAMIQANPQMREVLTNPETIRQMMNPNTLRAMMNLQQALGGVQGQPGSVAPAAAGAQPGGMPDFAALMGSLGGGGFGGLGGLGGSSGVPPVADPETIYATQIQQLVDMGFFDREANIRALQATGGNVNAAVERLLAG